MAQLTVTDLTFAYAGSYDNIFEQISFAFDTNWKLGLVGRNGRGKTTLLRLLMGEYDCRGSISPRVDCDYFPYEVPDKTIETVQAVRSMLPDLEDWKLLRELSLLHVSQEVLNRPFETLSNGEQTKVLLAALFLKEHNFLLIDEPTNHLDREARALVGDYLSGKKGFLLVSHDREFLDRCVDHILAINKTDITVQKGNFSSWWENRELRDRFEQAENNRLQKDIQRLSSAAKRTAGWSGQVEKTKYGKQACGLKADRGFVGHKAAKMMKRSKAIEERRAAAVEEKAGLLKNLETAERLKLSPLTYRSERLASLRGVSLFYESRPVCGPLDFTVERGDRIALLGRNGSGKSSLLKLFLDAGPDHAGTVFMGSGLVISYVPQNTSFLEGSLSGFAERHAISESLFKAILRKLDFSRVQFEKDMKDFSGGQKKKVLIAKSLCEPAHLYLWDEPLNFIDVFSRMQIEELLLEFCPTMLFVEHDAAFAEKIATKTVRL